MGSRIQLSDFVGDHGSYQLFITILLFIRYILLGLMANSGSLLTPDVTFYCKLPMEEIVAIKPNITTMNQTEQEIEIKEEFKGICQLDLHLYQQAYLNTSFNQVAGSSKLDTTLARSFKYKLNVTSNNIRECTDFTYDAATDQGRTMTSEFDLVCDRDWLRSLFQSLLSVAIVVAHVFWGTFSDKYGRYEAQKLCMVVSLLAGASSIFVVDFWTFAITRSLCSFGDLGLVVSLTTTVVELVGNQYRGLSVAIVNFGFALGVVFLPFLVAYFEDFKLLVAFTVLCHIITIPFVLTTNESILWLLTNRKFNRAKKELKRINKWNRHHIELVRQLQQQQQHKQEQHNSQLPQIDTKKVSAARAAEETAFNFFFKKFVDQLESQNICDPFGEESESSFASLEANPEVGVLIAEHSKPQSKDSHVVIIPPINNETNFVDNDYHLFKGAAEKPEGDDLCKNSIQKSTSERPSSCETGGGGSDSGIHLVYLEKKSCPEIDEGSVINNEITLTVDTVIQDNIVYKPEDQTDCSATIVRRASRVRQTTAAQQPDCINLVANQLSFVTRVSQLFKDKQLMIAVFTIVWTQFNSELQYTSYIIINLEVGDDVYLNYILGGCMEALAAVSASLLLSYAPRRQSLITFWLLISLSCFGLSIAHIDSTWAVWLLALAKFSQSCLSSIASVTAYESFPTFLRQSGSGLVFTLGMLGSVFAPLIFAEFDDHAGMDRVLMTFSFSSLTAAFLIYQFLKETKNCELR